MGAFIDSWIALNDLMDVGFLTTGQLSLLIMWIGAMFLYMLIHFAEPSKRSRIEPAGSGEANGDQESEAAKLIKAAEVKSQSGRIAPIDWSLSQIKLMCGKIVLLGSILCYAYMCENHPLFAHGLRPIGQWDFFWAVAGTFMVVGLFTLKKHKGEVVLNRDQTEEWKGWMQFLFVEYHYFHAVEVYNPIRLFVSSYVWMTGFGNFSFFYVKQDFGFVRLAQMFWRLNFLVLLLCVTMNNQYILYYIVPLHSFYFFMVYFTMLFRRHLNTQVAHMKNKLFALFIVIFVIWDLPGVWDCVFGWWLPGSYPPLGGIRHEWHFRSYLDHYSSAIGMVFAFNFPVMEVWFKKVEDLPPQRRMLLKGAIGAVLLAASAVWMGLVGLQSKFVFNARSPYSFWIPMLTYIYFRNCTVWLRQHHLGLFAWAGKITLETYLMQHHILLTENAKALLTLVPDMPMVNLGVVMIFYIWCAKTLYTLTLQFRAMFIPDDKAAAIRVLTRLFAALFAFVAYAWVLQAVAGVRSFAAVAMISVFTAAGAAQLLHRHALNPDGSSAKLSVHVLVGTVLLFVMVLGMFFRSNVSYPAVTQPELPPPPNKKLFVGTIPELGLFVVGAATVMIYLNDSFFGVNWLFTKCIGGTPMTIDTNGIFARLNEKIEAALDREKAPI